MDEEYDVIVLGTGLTVRFRAFITPHTDKTTHYQTVLIIIKLPGAFNPLFTRPEVKALHIPCALMSLYGCNNNKMRVTFVAGFTSPASFTCQEVKNGRGCIFIFQVFPLECGE